MSSDKKTDCAPFSELLVPYLDGELGSDDAKGLEAHLATCRRCEAFLQQHREVDGLIRQWAAQKSPYNQDTHTPSALAILRHVRGQVKRSRRHLVLSLAAGILVALSFLSLFLPTEERVDPLIIKDLDVLELLERELRDFHEGEEGNGVNPVTAMYVVDVLPEEEFDLDSFEP